MEIEPIDEGQTKPTDGEENPSSEVYYASGDH
jgi:hypothetical protein